MAEQRPLLITTERKTLLPLLIIDKTGILGTALAKKLHAQFLVVLVTPSVSHELAQQRNIIHIPYQKKNPLIPDNIYSHVFLFYNGESELIDMLPSFMKKANESAGKLFFVTPLFHSSDQLFRHLSSHIYHHMRIFLYGEIFDNELQEENLVNFFIHQARTQGRIEVPNGGMGRVYPVHTEDVLSALIATAFAHARTSRVLLAFPKHEVTELSVSRMLQIIHPYLKVDFRKYKRKQPQYFIPPDGVYVFSNYNLESRLRDIDITHHATRGERLQHKKILVRKKRRSGNPLLFVGILFLYFVALPLLLLGLFAAVGIGSLQLGLKEAQAARLDSANRYVSAAHFSFSSAQTLSYGLVYLDYPFSAQKRELTQQFSVGKQLAEISRDMLTSVDAMQGVADGKSTQPKQEFLHALATTKNSLLTLQKLKAEQSLPAQLVEKLDGLEYALQIVENTGDTLPTVLGFNGSKTYLILFQNNMELRPGGGFIGSYGLLPITNGKLGKLQIHDVYDADGKLTKHVEPPYQLRRYLGAPHWYLRDSNFDPDFTRNAPVAAQFLDLETGQQVDGVIAVDTAFVQKLLKAFGAVTVSDYNETVTADNFYLLTQTHAEKDFFPGSTQKKDFLRALFNSMLLHLEEKKQISYPLLAQSVVESIKGKHLMFASSDNRVQEAFTVNNLSGALWDGRSPADGTILDFVGVVDANVGTNKVNYYMKRSTEQRVTLNPNGDIESTLLVTYENTSKKDSPFGGDYKNYVRFLVPKNANLQALRIDNQQVQITPAVTDPAVFTVTGFVPPAELEVGQSEMSGKRAIGFLQLIPAGSKKTVSITTITPQGFNATKPSFTYKLRVFKQPGSSDDPFSLLLSYPQEYVYLADQKNRGVDIGGKVSYQSLLNEDKDLTLQFTKK